MPMRLFVRLLPSVFLSAIGFVGWASRSVAVDSQVKLTKTNVEATPESVFALIEDFRNWSTWSPHEKAGPSVQRTYSNPSRGPGATYEWEGGENIGAGRAQIAQASTAKIIVEFDLARPVMGHLALAFTLEGTGATTKIEVAANGRSELVSYVMSNFLNNSLMRIACAAGGSPKPICTIIMKDPVARP